MAQGLTLEPEDMQMMAGAVVERLVSRLADPASSPALLRATRAEMKAKLDAPPPASAVSFHSLLDTLFTDIVPFTSRTDHPRYFAFIPGCGTWPAALADFIASACNIYAGSWLEAAGPSQVELTVLDWFRTWIGYPSSCAGSFVSGGSAANITALACAREAMLGAMSDRVVVYVSDQGHSSLARAARTLGFRPEQLRVLPVDRDFRLSPRLLDIAMSADERVGKQPLFVVASAGTTNAGAVDPLAELATVTHDHGAWFHVDAAYGGFAALTARGKRLLAGLDLADSVTMDPHKWLFQPFECGALLVREGRRLQEAFEIVPDYLRDQRTHGDEVNFCDLGLQLSRSTRALKVWVSIHFFGLDLFRAAIDRALDLAEYAEGRIRRSAQLELLRGASLGIVCFRRRVDGVADEERLTAVNQALLTRLNASGEAFVSSTRLHGRYALRLCILNHTSTEADVDWVLDWIERAPLQEVSETPAVEVFERNPQSASSWLVESTSGLSEQLSVPREMLAGTLLSPLLDGGRGDVLLGSLRLRRFEDDDVIIERFTYGRDFYLVTAGEAVVIDSSDRPIRTLARGDHFGELAALDWGAGYSYPRTARVLARGSTEVVVVPVDVFSFLITTQPAFAREMQQAARERLQRV